MTDRSSPDIAMLAKRVETTPVDGKFGTRLFAMSDAERDLVVRLLRASLQPASPTAEMIAQFETGIGAIFSPKEAFLSGWKQAVRHAMSPASDAAQSEREPGK